jgi:hypothetical protein
MVATKKHKTAWAQKGTKGTKRAKELKENSFVPFVLFCGKITPRVTAFSKPTK